MKVLFVVVLFLLVSTLHNAPAVSRYLQSAGSQGVYNTRLAVNADRYTPFNELQIPTGKFQGRGQGEVRLGS